MPIFEQKITHLINSFEISVYEVNTTIEEQAKKLETFLVGKVKKIKAFKDIEGMVNLMNVPNIGEAYRAKLKLRLKEICNPDQSKISQFDVRRSFITEFMSQLLLEKQYNCIFYDHADKRLNADALTVNKHSPGIDVVGVHDDNGSLKFVVCEVKASGVKVPCTAVTQALLDDIQKSMDIKTKRLTREVIKYIADLQTDNDTDLLSPVISFLIEILGSENQEDVILNSIIFFPFLIRTDEDIIEKSDLRDFDEFGSATFKSKAIKGIIWSFNNDIDEFCKKIWSEAYNNV